MFGFRRFVLDALFVFGFDSLFGGRRETGPDCSLPITTVIQKITLKINSFHGRPRDANLETTKRQRCTEEVQGIEEDKDR